MDFCIFSEEFKAHIKKSLLFFLAFRHFEAGLLKVQLMGQSETAIMFKLKKMFFKNKESTSINYFSGSEVK